MNPFIKRQRLNEPLPSDDNVKSEMSEPSGRGLGRAGRGQDPKKSSASTSSARPSISTMSGRSGARAVPSSSQVPLSQEEKENIPIFLDNPKKRTEIYAGFFKETIGEPLAGFPKTTEVEEIIKRTPGLRIVTPAGSSSVVTPIGRGGTRGRRQIAVVDIVKTKPETCLSKQGDAGTKVSLTTNYFNLETMASWALYQYRVDFSIQEDRESVLRGWLREHRDRLKSAYIFDGTMLFSSSRLTVGNEPLRLTSVRESDKLAVEIEIKLVQQLSYGSAVYLQVFNILVRRCLLHLNLKLVNRNYFDPKASIRLQQHNLEIWPGYITSIKQHEKNVLMCTEITHKVMRTDTALKLLSECIKETKDYKRLFQQSMIGAIVLTDYNNKTYRIDDVDFSETPLSTFKYKNEESITYVKYYEQRYQIRIKDLKQPLLISRASARDIRGGKESQCLLIPELCRMTGLSSKMLENRTLMRDLAEITRVSPEVRIQRLKAFNARLQSEKDITEDFQQWGLSLSKELIGVSGRELPPEKIVAGRSTVYSAGTEVDWTRNMRTAPMLQQGKFDSFVVIVPSRIKRDIEEFLSTLKKSADGMQFRIPRPYIFETQSDSPVDLIEATERAVCEFHPDLIMYGFTSDRGDRYSAVKKKCYVDRGIPSQVILAKNMKAKGVMSIATKVAVQMNCKIGGAPWTVDIPTENVMVVGFDVCHGKSDKSKSVGAMVASLNRSMTAWYSSVSHHSGREELSSDLPLALWKALLKYKEVNNVLPARIFFYRDGVGEGQLHHVFNHEVAMMKKKLSELYGGETWRFAFIVVTKRIHTRFFANDRNPRPGTIVDDVITLPEKYDFFLVSQSVKQGTVSPTSYNVLSDNLGWGPNHIQRFTYKMTHLYYNCSVTVRVPAPCQYAHKLAFMVSQNLGAQPHANLATRLYFL